MTIFTAYNLRSQGGAGELWKRLVVAASATDAHVFYASPRPIPHTHLSTHVHCPCPAHPLGNLVYMAMLFLVSLFRWRVRPGDRVISQGILYTLPLLPLKWKGARICTIIHGDYFEELVRRGVPPFWRHLCRVVYEPMYRRSDLLLPVSHDLARRLRDVHGIEESRIRTTHNSMPPVPRSDPGRLAELRAGLGIEDKDLVLVYVGGLNPIKRVDRFIELVAGIAPDRPVKGIVVGDGSERRPLEALARKLGIDDRVRFVGWRTPATPYMEIADLLVLCSDYEGCPTVLLEGLRLGIAMVGSRVGGIPDILGDDRLTFRPDDDDALLTTVKTLLDARGRVEPWVHHHIERQQHLFSHNWEHDVLECCAAAATPATASG